MQSSSHRVLRNTAVAGTLSVEAAPPRAVLVGETVEQAYARGRRDGVQLGHSEATARLDTVGAGVVAALEGARRALDQLRSDQASVMTDTAVEIAEGILGGAPGIDRDVLQERIAQALRAVDDGPLTLFLGPDDIAVMGDALAERFGLAVGEDPALAPGEARVTGPWVDVELTKQAALEAVREALG